MNQSTSKAIRWRACGPLRTLPEWRLLVPGFGLSLVWEGLQSPFYADTFVAPWTTVAANRLHCAGSDAIILLAAFWIVALSWGRSWMQMAHWVPFLICLALGVAYTAGSEYVNVFMLQRWTYSQWMPTIGGVGVVPLLQWIVVPSMSVHVATGGVRHSVGAYGGHDTKREP
jgi:hypothetical protein